MQTKLGCKNSILGYSTKGATTSRERFERGILIEPNSGCWLWIGRIDRWGYGIIYLSKDMNKKEKSTHRFAWELFYGPIPTGLSVLHKCDVSCCANPNHLFLGTHKENMADMSAKMRQARGEKGGRSKLKTEQVVEIRKLPGFYKDIAARFGVDWTTISDIKRSKIWRHIP